MKSVYFVLSCAVLAVGAALFTFRDAPPPKLHPADERADMVLIDKAQRRLTLLRQNEVLAKYPLAITAQRPARDCASVGVYEVRQRNPKRIYRLSLGLADRTGLIGGDVLIHGSPRVPQAALSLISDKMEGCISLSNPQMREIWSRVTIGTEVVIR